MSKVIVLGASGFVGKALTPLLNAHNIPYIAPASKTLDLSAVDVVQKIADITQDGDSIIMLAVCTPEKGHPREINIKNQQMMNHVLKGIEGRKIDRFIYISSDAVYPLTSDIVDELTPIGPYSSYGFMHSIHERFLEDAIQKDKLTIFRPCAIYGDGDTHNAYGINRFIRSALEKNEIVLFGSGEEYRDHIHVDDTAALIFAAWQERIAGTFNAASGKSWRFSEIAAAIQSTIDKKITIIQKPRATPIFHRHVDISMLCSTFPAQRPRTIDVGIGQLLKISMAA